MKIKYTQPLEIKFSSRATFFKYLLYIYYPVFIYIAYFIFFAHKDFYVGYYLATAIIIIVITLIHYSDLSELTALAIKNESWLFLVKDNILSYYDHKQEKYFHIKLSDIDYVHQNIEEYTLIIVTNKERISIAMFTPSNLKTILIMLEDMGLKSIFKHRKENRYIINEESILIKKYYFQQSTLFFTAFSSLIGTLLISSFSVSQIFILSNPFFAKHHFFFALFWFMPFYIMIRELGQTIKLFRIDQWEIAIIDSKLIWNTPINMGESFILDLGDIEKVISKYYDDGEGVISYTYTIKMKSGEEIELNDKSGVSLSTLAPLIGRIEYKRERRELNFSICVDRD